MSNKIKRDNITTSLINAGVQNLKEFGYPNVNSENIMTCIYDMFFKKMLQDDMNRTSKLVKIKCDELIKEIDKNLEKNHE